MPRSNPSNTLFSRHGNRPRTRHGGYQPYPPYQPEPDRRAEVDTALTEARASLETLETDLVRDRNEQFRMLAARSQAMRVEQGLGQASTERSYASLESDQAGPQALQNNLQPQERQDMVRAGAEGVRGEQNEAGLESVRHTSQLNDDLPFER